KEGRSCSPLLETALAVSHLLLRFGGYAPAGAGFRRLRAAIGDFALCGARPKGSALWTSAAFEKAGETFPCGFAARGLLVCPLNQNLHVHDLTNPPKNAKIKRLHY
ncbi:MAG: hypothetical protein K2J11_05870, partial [Oscillospiraceae bacterium]|nr:hypothetical protein [Oscillospiraceae bacterium]